MNLSRLIRQRRVLSKTIAHVERFFKPFPHFPVEFVNVILDLMPAVVLALGILNATLGATIIVTQGLVLKTASQLNTTIDPIYVSITGMLAIANGILMVLAYSELESRKKIGWISLFVVLLITIVQVVLAFIFKQSGIIGTWIYAFMAFYFVFELKPYFRG